MLPPEDHRRKLLVLVGPTAIGKTALSIELARQWDAEIISGDSMQVYRGMDIGTAKIKPDEKAGIPHHLIDIHDPDYAYSAAEFQSSAQRLIEEIAGRGKLPFIVGGTGLYIESVCYGYRFSEAEANTELRQSLQQEAERYGSEELHRRLRQLDPDAADRLHPNDTRRIIRAIEVIETTGERLPSQQQKRDKASPYRLCLLCLNMDRQLLYKRIESRVDQMVQLGLIDEVNHLLKQGYSPQLTSMQGLGYKEIVSYLQGACTLQEAVDALKLNTRRFAKRQLSWFRHMGDVHWIDVTEQASKDEALEFMNPIISQKLGGPN